MSSLNTSDRKPSFGDRVWQVRNLLRFSQQEFIDELELPFGIANLRKIETGNKKTPDAAIISLFRQVLSVNPAWMTCESGDVVENDFDQELNKEKLTRADIRVYNSNHRVGQYLPVLKHPTTHPSRIHTANEFVYRPVGLNDEDAFAFRVVGDSMAPRFRDGSIVISSPKEIVQDNDEVLVMLNNRKCLVRIWNQYRDDIVRLDCWNRNERPVEVPSEIIESVSKVVGHLWGQIAENQIRSLGSSLPKKKCQERLHRKFQNDATESLRRATRHLREKIYKNAKSMVSEEDAEHWLPSDVVRVAMKNLEKKRAENRLRRRKARNNEKR